MFKKRILGRLLCLLLVSVLTVSAFADIAPLPDEEYDRIFGTGDIVIEPEPETEEEAEEEPSEDSGKDAEETENNNEDPTVVVVEEKTSGPSTALIVTMAVAVAVIAGAVLVRTVGMKKEGETK